MINCDRHKLLQNNLQISDNSEKALLFNTFSGSVCRLETEATLVEYYYDQRGRLLRENNYESNFTVIYAYITNGVMHIGKVLYKYKGTQQCGNHRKALSLQGNCTYSCGPSGQGDSA